MTINNALSLIDVAGSEKNWNRYKKSIETIIPIQFKKDTKRYTEMFVRIATNFIRDEKVTNKQSVLTCMYNAPSLGLNPDPVFGHIWFVVYKGVLTYQIGYRGMIRMSYNTGKIRNVRANLVYDSDEFDYYEDETGQHFKHRPKLGTKGKEICGYSIFEGVDSIPHFHIMETSHIEGIKKLVMSRMNGRKTPWSDPLFEPEMRKKTVIRRHWKTEPMSSEISESIEHEEKTENGVVDTPEEVKEKMEYIIDNVDYNERDTEKEPIALDTTFTSKL